MNNTANQILDSNCIGTRPEYDMAQIGNNLRQLRLQHNYTVEQIRDYLCIGSVQAIYKYERGDALPLADKMFALMELYNANLQDIIHTASIEKEGDNLSPSFVFTFIFLQLHICRSNRFLQEQLRVLIQENIPAHKCICK